MPKIKKEIEESYYSQGGIIITRFMDDSEMVTNYNDVIKFIEDEELNLMVYGFNNYTKQDVNDYMAENFDEVMKEYYLSR